MKEQIDIFDDLLIEFDEMGFVPTNFLPDHDSEYYAIDWKNRLINALEGYRKQNEGEWLHTGIEFAPLYECSVCRAMSFKYSYCPHCGARIKGGE